MAVFYPPNLSVLGMAPGVPVRPVYPWSYPWPPQPMLLENAALEQQLYIKRGTTCSARAADHDLLLLTSARHFHMPVRLPDLGRPSTRAGKTQAAHRAKKRVYIVFKMCVKCVTECNKNHEAFLRSLICPFVHRYVTAVGR